MSYEGFVQALCENGHDCSGDCYLFSRYNPCSKCGGEIVWENSVDTTNGFNPEDEITLTPKTYKTIKVVDTYHTPNNENPSK